VKSLEVEETERREREGERETDRRMDRAESGCIKVLIIGYFIVGYFIRDRDRGYLILGYFIIGYLILKSLV